MLNIKILTTAFIILIAVASCKKEKVNTPVSQTPVEKKMTQYTWTFQNNQPGTEFYEYDQAGRLKSQTNATRKYSFEYTPDDKLIVKATKIADNSLLYSYEGTLNEKGAITKLMRKKASGNVEFDYEFTYTSSGYLKKVRKATSVSVYEEEYEFVDDKPVSSKESWDGVIERSHQYFYDETKPNKVPMNHWYLWASETLFGKIFKYKPIEYKITRLDGTISWHTKTQYELDAEGYTLMETTDFVHQGTRGVGTYKYK